MVSNEVNCYKFPGKNGLDGITDPTSIKGEQPSWIDVIFTDTPRRVCDSLNFVTGLIDFYHIVLASSKMYVPETLRASFTYRKYTHFDEYVFQEDMPVSHFITRKSLMTPVTTIFFENGMFVDVLSHHAPTKRGRHRRTDQPVTHSKLREVINVKAMLRQRYYKNRTASN